MRNIFIIGDVHWKDSPYGLGLARLFDYWAVNYPESVFIFTGDFFDTSRPHWLTFTQAVKKLKALKSEIHIVQGNHDVYHNVGSALEPFREYGFNVYSEKTEVTIEGIPFLFLPHTDAKTMAKYPELEFKDGIVVTHFAPTGANWGIGELDLPFVENCIIIHGHIHIPDHDRRKWNNNVEHILGVPQTTRQGEEGITKYMCQVISKSEVKFLPLPTYFDIFDIKYGDTPSFGEAIPLLRVNEAPSEDAVYELYCDYFIKTDEIKVVTKDITLQNLDDIRKENGQALDPLIATWVEENKPNEGAMRRLYDAIIRVSQNSEKVVNSEE